VRIAEDGSRPTLWAAGPVAAAVSGQTGAALGATLLPLLGTPAVVGLRQTMAAIVLLPALLDPRHPVRWRSTWGAGLLGLLVIGMNVTVYEGISRIGLGLTITLQFLGPLSVALLGSRRPVDLGCAVAALAGVVLLTGTVAGTDPLGIVFGLLAGLGWALYILLGRHAAGQLHGLQPSALSSLVSAICTLPLLLLALPRIPADRLLPVLGLGLAAGVLSSALPYALDIAVLRRIAQRLFGVLQSVHPAAAALAGLVVLEERLSPAELVGLVVVSGANVVAVAGAGRSRRTPSGLPEATP